MSNKRLLFGNDMEDMESLIVKSLKFDIIDTFDDYNINTDGSTLKINKGETSLFEMNKNFCVSNKKIGIGIENPQYSLDVSGDINYKSFFINDIELLPTWLGNGNDIYFNTGNVGIGTSTPSNKLELYGVEPSLFVDGTSSSTIDLGLQNGLAISRIKSTTTSNSSDLKISVADNSIIGDGLLIDTTANTKFFGDYDDGFLEINSSGLGIKKTPAILLDLGNGTNEDFLRFDYSSIDYTFTTVGSGAGTHLVLKSNNTGSSNFNIKNTSFTTMTFKTDNTTANNRVIMNGSVGVRTDSPEEALHVDGNIIVDNGLIETTRLGGMLNFTYGLTITATKFISTSQTVCTILYTPVRDNSFLEICFDGTIIDNTGFGDDTIHSDIYVDNGTTLKHIMRHTQNHRNSTGGGGRGNTLLPISGYYQVVSSAQLTITLEFAMGGTNDTLEMLYADNKNHHFYIMEYSNLK